MKLGQPPASWAHLLAVAVSAAAGGGAAVAILMNAPNMPVIGVAVPALLGAGMTGTLAWYTARMRRGGLHALGGSVLVAMIGGPVLAAIAIAIKALANGAGGEVVGAVIVALAGIACGFFLTIPIGIALGVVIGATVGLARLTAPRSESETASTA